METFDDLADALEHAHGWDSGEQINDWLRANPETVEAALADLGVIERCGFAYRLADGKIAQPVDGALATGERVPLWRFARHELDQTSVGTEDAGGSSDETGRTRPVHRAPAGPGDLLRPVLNNAIYRCAGDMTDRPVLDFIVDALNRAVIPAATWESGEDGTQLWRLDPKAVGS